jgi:hypothetical protein
MSYFPSITQNTVIDTANSNSSTLGAGLTWNAAGIGTATVGFQGLQIVVQSTQNMTVYIEQGITNSTFQVTDFYDYNVVKDSFGVTVKIVSPYIRVSIKNIGLATATYSLNSTLTPITEPLPRSLDERGLLKTAVYEMFAGEYELRSNPMGTLDVDQPYRLVGTAFNGTTIDTTFWTATNGGAGSSVSAATQGIIILTSGTAAAGYANFVTVRIARFIFAHPHKFRSIIRLTTAVVANSIRRWGSFTAAGGPPTVPVDGFWFEQTGAGVLTLNCRNNSGTITTVSSGAFNGFLSSYIIDTNAHAFEIIYFLGSASYWADGVLLHTFYPTTTMLSSTFNLPAQFHATSSAISSSAVMEVWAGMVLRLGRDQSAPIWRNQAGAVTAQVAKNGPGVLRTFSLNSTVNGTVTLYDALTATNPIMTITTNGMLPTTWNLDAPFYTGLTYTTSAAGHNITLIFE